MTIDLENIQSNQIVQEKKIVAFGVTMDIPAFGKGNVKRIFKAGFNTIPKIMSMKVEDFLKINGFVLSISCIFVI